jgi:hypothetical protein
MMAANPVKPIQPTPPALPRRSPPAPDVTTEELADLRARLVRAEARVKELEAIPVEEAVPTANPFLAMPPSSPAALAESVPLGQLAPAAAAFVAARPGGSISISPSGLVSIMPFDGAKKRRRAKIAVITTVLFVVTAIVGVMVLSRAMH